MSAQCIECNGTGEITRTTPVLGVPVHERCIACANQGGRQDDCAEVQS